MRNKKGWFPIQGVWEADSKNKQFLDCIYEPGKRHLKPYELTPEIGIELLHEFFEVETVKQLVAFLNKWGSLELQEDAGSKDLIGKYVYVRVENMNSKEYLSSAFALRWLSDFKTALEESGKEVASYIHLSKPPKSRKKFADQYVRLAEPLNYFYREVSPRIYLGAKASWKYEKSEQASVAVLGTWGNALLRMAMTELLGNALRLRIDADFKTNLAPGNPVDLIALSLLEEFSAQAFRRKCEGPGCENNISLTGKNARRKQTRFCSDTCKHRAYDHRKRTKTLKGGSAR